MLSVDDIAIEDVQADTAANKTKSIVVVLLLLFMTSVVQVSAVRAITIASEREIKAVGCRDSATALNECRRRFEVAARAFACRSA